MAPVAATDERRHPPGPQWRWAESWDFDFSAGDASLAGYVRLALYPHLGTAWYWAALVGRGRRLVMVKDHDLEPPRGRDLEIRGQGIWSAVNCETPLDHWSVGLEAFAVAYDDPMEAWGSERGDLVGLGYDLEWEATAEAEWCAEAGYRQPCRVTGEILVGDEQIDFDGPGQRSHHWGIEDWWSENHGPKGRPDNSQILAAAPVLLEDTDGRRAYLMRALMADTGGTHWTQWLEPL